MAINRVDYGGETLIDISDTTAAAADVASGKYFYTNAGVKTLGTAEGGGGGGGGGGETASPKDVNFIDYDGTIRYSYTAEEFAALTAMPANPDHSGDDIPLTSQGWNWSFANAQAYVAKYGKLEVGQMYKTTDNKTHVLIHLEEGRTSPILGCCPNGTVTVDWGDGTATDTLTGTSVNTVKWTPAHNYSDPGDYHITLTCTGTMGFYGSSSSYQYAGLLRFSTATDRRNHVYQSAIVNVYCADTVTSIGIYSFSYCYSLSTITLPDTITSIGNYAFNYCRKLTSITLPNSASGSWASTFYSCYGLSSVALPDNATKIGNAMFSSCYILLTITLPDTVTSIGSNAFSGCNCLTNIVLPDSVTSISSAAFSNCNCLTNITLPDATTKIESNEFTGCYCFTNITLPDSVTSIGANAFNSCFGILEYHFLPTTPPTLGGTNAFTYIATDCIMYVPQGCLEAYQTATNWSNYASHMQEETA